VKTSSQPDIFGVVLGERPAGTRSGQVVLAVFQPFYYDGRLPNLKLFSHHSLLAMVEKSWDLGSFGFPELFAVPLLSRDCIYGLFYEAQRGPFFQIVNYSVTGGNWAEANQ
jgi:hypothetical protein